MVYKGFFDVRVDLLSLRHGPKKHYAFLEMGCHAALVLAETPDGKLVINQEYRHPTKQWLLSCPGGRIDGGESPIDAAQRELLEETGYTAKEWIYLGACYPQPAVSDQQLHYILAKHATLATAPQREEFEVIHTVLKTPEELMRDIRSGHKVDGILCTALFLRTLHI